ncbi:MAG TPA: hypothetical protein VM076_23450 [Gemmatimonadaceae bacterium]|nr:hypothetical protein [Gemmatimonadaceae bacterium]
MESTSSVFDREPGGVPLPPPPLRDRDGLSALERKALFRVHTELPAMPASLVVQILLWPEKITDWARDESVTPALVYNMLGGFKPYHGLRERLAHRLGVTKAAVDHLIDARRQQPSTRRIPEPPPDFVTDDVSLAPSLRAKPANEGPNPISTAREQDNDDTSANGALPPPTKDDNGPPADDSQTSLFP